METGTLPNMRNAMSFMCSLYLANSTANAGVIDGRALLPVHWNLVNGISFKFNLE